MYRVELAPRARRELRRVGEPDKSRLATALSKLAREPRPAGSLKLKGPIYRLRVGSYRIIYAVSDHDESVVALKIARREKDTYERLDELF
ncbi:MAG: type II toxin-antitoxin system RelE/ParE family toxin [Dehalococcoidia bacterium]|nr:type II toxin-antitoxin system RelE/ParE family toxin [Dehalococcoidia bacterium]